MIADALKMPCDSSLFAKTPTNAAVMRMHDSAARLKRQYVIQSTASSSDHRLEGGAGTKCNWTANWAFKTSVFSGINEAHRLDRRRLFWSGPEYVLVFTPDAGRARGSRRESRFHPRDPGHSYSAVCECVDVRLCKPGQTAAARTAMLSQYGRPGPDTCHPER